MDAPLSRLPQHVAIGTRPLLRVPIVSRLQPLPVAVASLAIVALGLADGGYGQSSWWPETVAFLVVGLAALMLGPHVAVGNPARLTVAALCGLTVWSALSAYWAPDGALAITDARRGVLYIAVLVALLLVAQPDGRTLAKGTFAGVVALAEIALAELLLPFGDRGADPFEGYLLSEPIGYANAAGALAGIGVVLALLLRPEEACLGAQRLGAVGAVACVAALALSGSRGAVLAVFVGLATAVALACDRRSVARWLLALAPGVTLAVALCCLVDVRGAYPHFDLGRSTLLAAGLVGAAFVSAFTAPFFYAYIASQPRAFRLSAAGLAGLAAASAAVLATQAEALTDSRLAYWRVAMDMARHHPLFGAGSGSFASFWQASGADRGALDAHGAFVEAAAELGLPGLVLLSLVLLTPLAAGVRARTTPWVAVVTGAYAAAVFHAGLDWDRELPVVVIVASALAASLLTADTHSN